MMQHNNNSGRRTNSNNNYRGGGGRPRGGRGNRGPAIDPNLPWEEGLVCTLKDSFGFIYCADRPEEVFFHYSSLNRQDFPDPNVDLQLQQEVQFQVAPSKNDDKLAAYNVRLVAQPVQWEIPEEPVGARIQGLVEKASSSGGAGGFGGYNDQFPGVNHNTNMDGSIRVLMKEVTNNDDDNEEGGEKVELTADGPAIRFMLKDYEATKNTNERRSPRLFKGDLVEFEIVTDRRTKEKYAKNIALLQSEKERARVAAEQKMLEDATEEHGVITSLKGEYGFLKSNKRREEVFFHYSTIQLDEQAVENDGEGDGSTTDLVLKEGQEMKFLVVTEDGPDGGTDRTPRRRISARNVQMQPRGSVKFHDHITKCRTGVVLYPPQPHDSGHLLDHHGKIRLHEPVTVTDDETGAEKIVHEIYLHISDAPGGSFQFRGGTSVGMYVQAGDILLFDVIQDFVDGSCHAGPTKSLTPTDVEPDEANEAVVRFIKMALPMRAEGVINNVKENYGFLHYSERPVDVHFKLFQVLPDSIQKDLRRNIFGYEEKENRPLRLEVGTEVSFDLSVHGTIHSANNNSAPSRRNRRGGTQDHERENLKAQRILFLPRGTIVTTKKLGIGVEGVITKQDAKQPYAGSVELNEALDSMSLVDRHPIVAKMIQEYLDDEKSNEPIVFHDIQTSKEDDIVARLIDIIAPGKLKWRHSSEDDHEEVFFPPGKMVIYKVSGDEKKAAVEAKESMDVSDDNASYISSGDEAEASGKEAKKKKRSRRLQPKTVTTVRYDKGSLSADLRKDIPPNVGDKVIFDVIQSRRTGAVNVVNMKMVERQIIENPTEASDDENIAMGVVTEVLSQRKFGFISVLDETAAKTEALFFQFSAVESTGKPNGPPLRKGDEVKFTIGTEKNGKRVALNIKTIPRGTIPSKADKNACTGIVLLEPTHTELKNTKKLNAANSTASNQSNASSRWASGDEKQTEEVPITEQGCLLLTKDPASLFRTQVEDGTESDEPSGIRLHYKNGAVAIHGTGASSVHSGDDSHPKRGDLVTFMKSKKSDGGVRDIRIATRGAVSRIRGKLVNIQHGSPKETPSTNEDSTAYGTAQFVVNTEENVEQKTFDISLSEIVGCEISVLKENESVEAIFHEGKVYGISRTSDLYLESKLSAKKSNQRPRLNLTVKKDRAGKIQAQSAMARGPDGTNGFAPGWTTRKSRFASD